MPPDWKLLEHFLKNDGLEHNLCLSLIDREGNLLWANEKLKNSFQINCTGNNNHNFFNFFLKDQLELFKKALHTFPLSKMPISIVQDPVSCKTHPVKWDITFLEKGKDGKPAYLCVGYPPGIDKTIPGIHESVNIQYQQIVDNIGTGIIIQDIEGELITANQKAAEIFGISLKKLNQVKNIRSGWFDWGIINENDEVVKFSETPFMRTVKTGQKQTGILQLKLRNNERRWVSFESQPMFNNNNTALYSVVTSITDVTDERLMRLRSEESDTLFRSFMSKTPNLAWVVDQDNRLLLASDAFYRYFGCEEKDIINKNIFNVIPITVTESLYAKHRKVLETGEPIESIEKMKWADGTNFVFHLNLFLIELDGNKKRVGGHAVNLADKFAAEKKLKEVNERLLMLSRATTDAIWEWDMQTGYIFRNDALMDMVGYQGEETKGLTWWLRRIHPEDRNRVTDTIKNATDTGHHSWSEEYRFKCSDGTYKNIQDKGYVVYENGLPVKMIGSLQDITEIKTLELQLGEEKLLRQKEISETVIRVQEKERTRIGHELHDNVNQILSTVKMFVEMITPANDEEQKIKTRSIEYLLTSIEEIRKLSKELVVPQLKEKGLTDSIYALIEDIQITNKLKMRFVHDLESDLLSPGKKITLFRIVQEQIKNILKYSKASEVEIILSSKDDVMQLIIKDNGIGFDTHQSHKGIGIANIHDRTLFYNGHADIQSAPGKGCILTVSIPLL